jgi:hypothetical protein
MKFPRFFRLLGFLLVLLIIAPAEAGLRDIHPRPQQMGVLAANPAIFTGIPFLVIPANPTAEELRVRDEAMRMIAMRLGNFPEMLEWPDYHGQTPAIWLGTFTRFPQLAAALDSSGLPGLGTVTHPEEYQLLVQDQRILLGGNELRGLRWGVQSLVQLMSEAMGRFFVERVYLRDWPDLAERVGTVNSGVNTDPQAAYAHRVVDASYNARMNEIEWNSGLGAATIRTHIIQRMNTLTAKMKNYGLTLSVSADNTAKSVGEYYWREGVAVRDMPLLVTDSALVPLANGYPTGMQNGGMESWVNGKPAGYTMYNDTYFDWVSQDTAERHGGSNSARIALTSGAPASLDLRQRVYVGKDRMLRFRVWYKVAGFKGKLRIRLMGTGTPLNRYEDRYVTFGTATTQDWTVKEFDFRSFNADTVLLMIGSWYSTAGTLWMDDIEFTTGGVWDLVRRPDTPVDLYRQRQNLLMAEGADYRVVEMDTVPHTQYVLLPRLERIAGGRLAVGDTVRLNYYCAMTIGDSDDGKQVPCFSMMEPLVDYQARVARIDSLLRPDGFKIHINEVSYADCDPLCQRRNLSTGQLVGKYCNQMYNIIAARRPGAPVRIYGDSFDIFADDSRAMPLIPGVPWTTGARAELSPAVEVMAMTDYSRSIDSTIAYFSAGGRSAIVANALWSTYSAFLTSGLAARRQHARGLQFYMWEGNCDTDLETRVQDHGDLAWNLGPYISHLPPVITVHPDSITIEAEMWTDSFHVGAPVSLTATTLTYRILPGGTWATAPLARTGTDMYRGVIRGWTVSTTQIEYYLSATDHRAQTRTAPADAPARAFRLTFPAGGAAPGGGTGGEEIQHSLLRMTGATLVQWTADRDADWYELHIGNYPDFSAASPTRLARQRPGCARYLLLAIHGKLAEADQLHVYAMRETATPDPGRLTRIRSPGAGKIR